MGHKDAAKKAMSKAGIPVVPGYHGENQTDERLKKEAESIGYPVLIKAVAGGGGKGMRLVESPKEFLTLLASARTEAEKAFGNGRVLIEKYILAPVILRYRYLVMANRLFTYLSEIVLCSDDIKKFWRSAQLQE